ncbi:MAG: heme o synthase [Acidimicrobiia bacterium]
MADTSELAGRADAFGSDGRLRRAYVTARAYFLLTKPRVIELLLVTTVPAMILAAGELPSLTLIAEVLVGGALAAGGANTINCWIERDRDQVMGRTRNRPLPTGAVSPDAALVFGLLLEAGAFALLWATVNLLSAALAVGAMLFYVFVYTIWLKPRSPQNIVIGGAAGAVPVLVGWASVTNELAAAAWVLFAIVFFWTPPHFWALSLRYFDDYKRAGIPMLPVAKGIPRALTEIVVYSFVVVACTLALPAVSDVGAIYVVAAVTLGVMFIVQSIRLARGYTPERAIRFFTMSNTYLALLFAAVAVDTIVQSI